MKVFVWSCLVLFAVRECAAFSPVRPYPATRKHAWRPTKLSSTPSMNEKFDMLEPGDIICFSPEPNCLLSQAICLLTGGPVSHAAIVYSTDPPTIAEETPNRAGKKEINETNFKDRTLHVKRLTRSLSTVKLDMKPVLDKANSFINQGEPFGSAQLYLVAVLLLTQKTKWLNPRIAALNWILKKLMPKLADLINSGIHPGKKPMFCSQFVFECFDDAGEKYKIKLGPNPVIVMAKNSASVDQEHQGTILDTVLQKVEKDEIELDKSVNIQDADIFEQVELAEEDGEEILSGLVELLEKEKEKEKDSMPMQESAIPNELAKVIVEFAVANYDAQDTAKQGGAKDKVKAKRALMALKEPKSVFVTPADLYKRCTNLEDVVDIAM